MAKKVPVTWNGTHRVREASFNQGLIVSDYKELYFLTGQVDVDAQGNCRHPGDPAGQAKGIMDNLSGMLAQEGWSLNDVIKVEITVTKDVDLGQQLDGIFEVWADTFKDVNPKPSAGTLRVSYALARPGIFVEFEYLAAR